MTLLLYIPLTAIRNGKEILENMTSLIKVEKLSYKLQRSPKETNFKLHCPEYNVAGTFVEK